MESTTTISEELSKLDKQREESNGIFNTYKAPDLDNVRKSANRTINKLRKIWGKGKNDETENDKRGIGKGYFRLARQAEPRNIRQPYYTNSGAW